jgi:hypothetical protein
LDDTVHPIDRRLVESRIRQALRDTPVVSISGPRQSGKTPLVRNFATRTRRYVTLDSVTMRNAAQLDPESFIADANQITVDEVPRAPDLLLAIKKSVDEDRRPGRFILTGSANLAGVWLPDNRHLVIAYTPLARAGARRSRDPRCAGQLSRAPDDDRRGRTSFTQPVG